MAEAAKNTPGAKGPEGSDKPIAATPSESSDQTSKGSLSQRAEELSARLEEHKKQAKAAQDERAAKAAAAAKAAFLNPTGAAPTQSKTAETKPAAAAQPSPAAPPTTVQSVSKPAAAKPAVSKPAVSKPAAAPAKPAAANPATAPAAATAKAAADKPAAAPAASKPAVKKPVAAKPAATKPAPAKPAAASAAKPKADEPVEDVIRAIKLPHEIEAEKQVATPVSKPAATAKAPVAPAKQGVPPVSAAPQKDNPETSSAAVAQARTRVFGNYTPESVPSEAAVKRRVARERALNSKPPMASTAQVLLAIIFPVLTLIAAIRLVATPAFLAMAYARPGFPSDRFGFTDPERLTYGSYGVDYLNNFAGPEYLSGLKLPTGSTMFTAQEVQHMLDVKNLIGLGYVIGAVLAVLAIVFIVYLANRYAGGVRRALFAGAIVTVVLFAAVAALAITGWNTFFTGFHNLFFSEGTWTFNVSDTLIRLYPEQFWMDSAVAIGVLMVLTVLVVLIACWPTARRREGSRLRQEARVFGLGN
ncbi:TIGR01906 family membrane protein [Glutamicibacter sp.]|uniref:TIGR01906 family membrane protein n=1 Tax=Glutamicibacter sp. TaxID=1931995 RepID=UPI002B463EEB|nr:TIGR01906 family membrane protein [Glutamicibacter sp.]HJX78764.1 TIGR01906 family membrane protein [Glutamicibacter sp.]